MEKHELELAAQLLQMASDRFSNDCCTDYEFPESWTDEQVKTFSKEYHEWNGDPEEEGIFDNWVAMDWIAEKLKREATHD